jgi:hypothetical protein
MACNENRSFGLRDSLFNVDKSFIVPSVSFRAIVTVGAIVGVVVIPQFFHLFGSAIGVGSLLGRVFLPMYFPIIIVGLIGGSTAGIIAGLFGPVISFLISGMPIISKLPAMVFELVLLGFIAGLLNSVKGSLAKKLAMLQITGLISLFAIEILSEVVLETGSSFSSVFSAIGSTVLTGLPGILLQWVLIPVIVSYIRGIGACTNESKDDNN